MNPLLIIHQHRYCSQLNYLGPINPFKCGVLTKKTSIFLVVNFPSNIFVKLRSSIQCGIDPHTQHVEHAEIEISRQLAGFQPSIWGDHFLECHSDFMVINLMNSIF